MENANILITGGAGYLGSVLTEALLNQGFKVTVLDKLIYGEQSLFHLADRDNFNFVYGDTCIKSDIIPLLKTCDIIIPLAAIVGAKACDHDPILAKEVNYESIKMINSLRSKQQIIIYPCTNSGYGTKSGEIFCTEDTPLEPISLYGRTKVEAEKLLLDSDNVITLRLATVFGLSARMRLDLLVNHFVYCAYFDGYIIIYDKDFKRNYVHIKDVADAFIHCINNFSLMKNRPYNLGLDEANLSKKELAYKVKDFIPNFYIHFAEVGYDPDKRNYIVSNERMRQAGFTAKRSIEQGIRELIKGYSIMGRRKYYNA